MVTVDRDPADEDDDEDDDEADTVETTRSCVETNDAAGIMRTVLVEAEEDETRRSWVAGDDDGGFAWAVEDDDGNGLEVADRVDRIVELIEFEFWFSLNMDMNYSIQRSKELKIYTNTVSTATPNTR